MDDSLIYMDDSLIYMVWVMIGVGSEVFLWVDEVDSDHLFLQYERVN